MKDSKAAGRLRPSHDPRWTMHTVAVETTRSEPAVRRRPVVPFPAAKLVPPAAPARLVQRPRLHELIERGTEGLVTLVSAHAGTGKTVLLSSWAGAAAPRRVAWLALDRDDNWSPRFWLGVERALANAGALRGRPTGEGLVTRIAERIDDRAEPVVLVLDDFHEIESPIVHRELQTLLDHGTGSLRVVISTRADPRSAAAAAPPHRRPDRDPRRRAGVHDGRVRRGARAVRGRPRRRRRRGAARSDGRLGRGHPSRRAVARLRAGSGRLSTPVRRRRPRRGRLPPERDPRPTARSPAGVPAPHLRCRTRSAPSWRMH